MVPRKLKILFCFYAYGGNGAVSSEVPNIREWIVPTVLKLNKDPRVESVQHKTISDTPITMSRNASVISARECGADVLVMVDSDMYPDFCLGSRPNSKPFIASSFDFLYKHYDKGPCVIGAPYGGPPPVENCYVFKWANFQSDSADPDWRIECFSREEAAIRGGIENVAALPTGITMWDMRCFELTDPQKQLEFLMETQGMTEREAKRRVKSWFYYEYKDIYESKKASTEDVTATRDVAMFGQLKLGYSPVYCNWDAWAAHWKPKPVGPPRPPTMECINDKYVDAVLSNRSVGEQMIEIGAGQGPDGPPPEAIAEWEQPESGMTEDEALDLGIKQLTEALPMTEQFGDGETICELVRSLGDRPLKIVEVGTWLGNTAKKIAKILPEGSMLYCVDTWKGATADVTTAVAKQIGSDVMARMFARNLRDYADSVTVVQEDSATAGKQWVYGPVDMVFIDADHSYECTKADIEAWKGHVKPGGIVSGHDYGIVQFPGVPRAVSEHFPSHECRGSVWWYRVPDHTKNGHKPRKRKLAKR